jgi:hypothetical protein
MYAKRNLKTGCDKMKQLGFDPSEPWIGVEKNHGGEKAPHALFWHFFASGLLLAEDPIILSRIKIAR